MLAFNAFTRACSARGRNGTFMPNEVHIRESDAGDLQICVFSKASGYNPPIILEGPLPVLLDCAHALVRELEVFRTRIDRELQGLDAP